MRKRIIIWISALAVVVAVVVVISLWLEPPRRDNGISQKDVVDTLKRLGRLGTNPPPVYVPIDLKRPVRLAIGPLGFDLNEQNSEIQDLVLARLTGAPGLELVERQSLESVLHELNLTMAGLVRAKDAVRVGKLMKADWFLLGTSAKIAGTNSLVLRIVDARSGIMRDAAVFSAERPTTEIAADLADFVRESRKSAAAAQPREFLAIGGFKDIGINRRQAAFPTQLRSYLTAAYQGSGVTLLEREAVDILFQEARLDLAGLTEGSETNAPEPIQSAYWLVNGVYQSYETTNSNVELVADVTRVFGRFQRFSFRGKPDAGLFAQVKNTIDWQMKTNAAVWPTRYSEARAQLAIGKELANVSTIFPTGYREEGEVEAARRQRNIEEAIRAFEAALLLDPTNREAKLYLAACRRTQDFSYLDEARNIYREIIEEPVGDMIELEAKQALQYSFEWSSLDEKARWYRSAIARERNSRMDEFYRQQAEAAEKEIILRTGGPQAMELAERQLPEQIATGIGGTHDFLVSYGTNQIAAARRLVELYPMLKATLSNSVPYVLAAIVVVQPDTNAPIVWEFQRLLESYPEHPDDLAKSKDFWRDIWRPVCDWSFDHELYQMAAVVIQNKTRAANLHSIDGMNDEDKMNLAFAYLGLQEWRKALEIFETYSNRPVQVGGRGPWGEAFSPVFTSKLAAHCRQKLGLLTETNPLEFSMGEPVLGMHTPSCFIADDSGLWVGIHGQLLRLSFNLQTNFVVPLPMSPSTAITTLSLHSSNVWIGTAGEGLIKYEQGSHEIRRFTVNEGLVMNAIACTRVYGDLLWIGYGTGRFTAGGLGFLDLLTSKFRSFTPSIAESAEAHKDLGGESVSESADQPPRYTVGLLAVGSSGEVWFETAGLPLRRYQWRKNAWDVPCSVNASSLAANTDRLFVGQSWFSHLDVAGPIGVTILDLKTLRYQSLGSIDGLPSGAVTTLALDGENLWVGGTGYIALFDTASAKVRKYAYVPAAEVDRIQIGGGYVWAQFDGHLYRASLSGL